MMQNAAPSTICGAHSNYNASNELALLSIGLSPSHITHFRGTEIAPGAGLAA